jgi:hypothetical protein
VLGAPKCGTSALYNVLRKHPRFVSPKEGKVCVSAEPLPNVSIRQILILQPDESFNVPRIALLSRNQASLSVHAKRHLVHRFWEHRSPISGRWRWAPWPGLGSPVTGLCAI